MATRNQFSPSRQGTPYGQRSETGRFEGRAGHLSGDRHHFEFGTVRHLLHGRYLFCPAVAEVMVKLSPNCTATQFWSFLKLRNQP